MPRRAAPAPSPFAPLNGRASKPVAAPDSRCPTHGDPYVFYAASDGYPRRRCLACYQERSGRRRLGGPTCFRGHVKTPWTWRRYGVHWRCMTCHNERARARRAAKAAAA